MVSHIHITVSGKASASAPTTPWPASHYSHHNGHPVSLPDRGTDQGSQETICHETQCHDYPVHILDHNGPTDPTTWTGQNIVWRLYVMRLNVTTIRYF